MLTMSPHILLSGDTGYPHESVPGRTSPNALIVPPQDAEHDGSPDVVGEDRSIQPRTCTSKMCFGDGGVSAGQRLAFAALEDRSFAVTKEAANRSIERKINLQTIATYGKLVKTNNGTAYVRYGTWEARLSLRNGTIMTVVIW